VKFFVSFPEFRRLLDIRLKMHAKSWAKLLRIITFPLSRSHNLWITAYEGIGGGLKIHHGFSSIITCKKMGKNCEIFQQVTVGWTDGGCPTIGDDVIIYAGAKVFGDVVIGNDVIIGANAVVTKSIPNHSIVVGVPATIIKRRNSIDEEWIKIDRQE
jgi:serine O-acetyltransferase